MEYIKGGEIFSLEQGKLDGSHAKIILYQLLKAIRDLRAANVVHRDLKPENIIFNNTDCKIHQNSLKLVDFGFSVLCQEEAKFIHRRCGTPGFASPEVLNLSQEATPEVCVNSDIYSAGLIFYFMLTGIMAFDGNDTLDILKNNKKAKLDFQISQLQEISPHSLDLLKKMLRRNRQERITPEKALKHPYFSDCTQKKRSISLNPVEKPIKVYNNSQKISKKEATSYLSNGANNSHSVDFSKNNEEGKQSEMPTPSFKFYNNLKATINNLRKETTAFDEVATTKLQPISGNTSTDISPQESPDGANSKQKKGFIVKLTHQVKRRKLAQVNCGKNLDILKYVHRKNMSKLQNTPIDTQLPTLNITRGQSIPSNVKDNNKNKITFKIKCGKSRPSKGNIDSKKQNIFLSKSAYSSQKILEEDETQMAHSTNKKVYQGYPKSRISFSLLHNKFEKI